ncbi:hypothetical protein [Skermanella aerolata]|uniref:hypothetical protein n=1 Tax=Skermanella aerolata TaxID=393310 RepID=UPI0014706E77|nr:hypothetical protein [Skermanella aerolata]
MIIQIPPIRLLMKRLINSVLIDETMKYRKAQVLLSIDHIKIFLLPAASLDWRHGKFRESESNTIGPVHPEERASMRNGSQAAGDIA